MPFLAALLVNVFRWLLFTYAGKLVLSVLVFFGLSFTTQKLVTAPFTGAIQAMATATPSGEFAALAVQWMGVLNFDRALTMICAAFVTAQTIKAGKVALSKVSS